MLPKMFHYHARPSWTSRVRRKFSAFMDTPKTEKTITSGTGPSKLRFGVGSMQGWRTEMEDAHMAKCGLGPPEFAEWSFFAIFDGHAGQQAAKYAAMNILQTILRCTELREATDPSKSQTEKNDLMHLVFAKSFLTLDLQMRRLPTVANGEERSGTTVVCALIGPDIIYFSNLGDSRAIAVSHGSLTVATEDHKPFRACELKRIAAAGGTVSMQRINGNLAVSRALGDYDYKNRLDRGPFEQLVSTEPDMYPLPRKPDEEFVVLACDGVWDVVSNEEFYRYIRYQLTLTADLDAICANLMDMCLGRGSRDNITIILIVFPGAPAVSIEAKAAEKLFEDNIKRAVCEIASACSLGTLMDGPSLTHLVQKCLDDRKVKVPDGSGGAKNKRIFIEMLWKQMQPDKPLRPETGEVSPTTVLKVLNRALSSQLNLSSPVNVRNSEMGHKSPRMFTKKEDEKVLNLFGSKKKEERRKEHHEKLNEKTRRL